MADLPTGTLPETTARLAAPTIRRSVTAEQVERRFLRRALAVAAVSRAGCFLIAYLTSTYAGTASVSWMLRARLAEPFAHASVLAHIFNPWAHWDGVWYIRIASAGYVAKGSAASFPLYPLCLRAVTPIFGGNYVAAGICLSLAFFVAAVVLLFKLVSREFDARVAFWTVVCLSLFPTSFFFQAVYTESLFLLTTVACFFWARRERWALAGLAAMLATLTRSSGVLLLLPLALIYLAQRDWRWRRIDPRALWMLCVPAGLGIWMAYLGLVFGNPLRFMRAEGLWNRHLTLPPTTLWHGFVGLFNRSYRLLAVGDSQQSYVYYLAAAAVVFLIWVLVAGWRRLPASYTAYALAATILPLCFPTPKRPFESMPRFVLAIFPAFVVMALARQRWRWLRVAVLTASVSGLIWLTAEFAYFHVVA
jgi:hypothetical protein